MESCRRSPKYSLGLMATVLWSGAALAMEDTKVLPKGVRNLNIRSVNTDFDRKTNATGIAEPLGKPLAQDLTFAKIVKDQDQLKGIQLKAFLASNGTDVDTAVGSFTSDLRGHLSVVAPIVSYGLTEKITVALAVPYYSAATSASMGFRANGNASAFLTALAKPENNQVASAHEAASDLSHAVGKLEDKLSKNGFASIGDWSAQGLGDVTLAAKVQNFDSRFFAVASTPGVVAPTGRVKDPDVLTDVPFGNGVWAPFYQVALDEKLPFHVTINQYAKYTAQLAGSARVRAITDAEKIAAEHVSSQVKRGDIVNTGASIRFEPNFGLVAGVGYGFMRKYGDRFRGDFSDETRQALGRDSDQQATTAEFKLGYSTVPLYLAKTFAVPFDVDFTFAKQVASRNLPVTDLAQFDLNLYF